MVLDELYIIGLYYIEDINLSPTFADGKNPNQEYPELVVGIDICGDPHRPTVTPYLLPALQEPMLFFRRFAGVCICEYVDLDISRDSCMVYLMINKHI